MLNAINNKSTFPSSRGSEANTNISNTLAQILSPTPLNVPSTTPPASRAFTSPAASTDLSRGSAISTGCRSGMDGGASTQLSRSGVSDCSQATTPLSSRGVLSELLNRMREA